MSVDTMRTLVRRLGDVEVIVRLPMDMPDPFIALSVHRSYTTAEQRAVSIDAFGMDEDGFQKVSTTAWFKAEVGSYGPGHMQATVFVESEPIVKAA